MSIAAYISGKTLRRDMNILFHYGFYFKCYTLHLSHIQMYCISYILKTISTALMHSDVTQQHYTTQNKSASHTPHHNTPYTTPYRSRVRTEELGPLTSMSWNLHRPTATARSRPSMPLSFACSTFFLYFIYVHFIMCILLCVFYILHLMFHRIEECILQITHYCTYNS